MAEGTQWFVEEIAPRAEGDSPEDPAIVEESDEAARVRADAFKARGNAAFGRREWAEAKALYSEAIGIDDSVHAYYSNRSACHAAESAWGPAAADAAECVRLAPEFVKGHVRLARALLELGDVSGARGAVKAGLRVDVKSAELMEIMRMAKAKEAEQAATADAALRWSALGVSGAAPLGRGGHTASAVGSTLYVFGGANRGTEQVRTRIVTDLWSVDLAGAPGAGAELRWAEATTGGVDGVTWPAARTGHAAVVVGTRIVILGGQDPMSMGEDGANAMAFEPWVLETTTMEWSHPAASGEAPSPRAEHAACLCADGATIVVAGGVVGGAECGEVRLLDTRTWAWSEPTLAQPFAPRQMHASCSHGGEPWFVGGTGGGAMLSLAQRLAVAEDGAVSVAAPCGELPRQVCALAVAPLGEELCAFGGISGQEPLGRLFICKPGEKKGAWRQCRASGTTPCARFGHTLTAVEGVGCVCFGGATVERELADLHVMVRTEEEQ